MHKMTMKEASPRKANATSQPTQKQQQQQLRMWSRGVTNNWFLHQVMSRFRSVIVCWREVVVPSTCRAASSAPSHMCKGEAEYGSKNTAQHAPNQNKQNLIDGTHSYTPSKKTTHWHACKVALSSKEQSSAEQANGHPRALLV